MNVHALHEHPAYLALSVEDRLAVDTRLSQWHLDAAAVAALTGGVDTLEPDDLRFWLQSTQSRPWAMITLGASSPQADELFQRALDLATDLAEHPQRAERVRVARELSRAFAIAASAFAEAGFLRDEELGALWERLVALEAVEASWTPDRLLTAARESGFGEVSAAVSRHQRETSGLRGLLARATARMRTRAFNLAHGGAYLLTGTTGHEGRYEGGRWSNWTEDYAVVPTRYACPRDEETLRRIVADARQLRVVGGGHSFNDSPLCADTLVSLDALDRVLGFDPLRRTMRVQAGVRLRDLNKVLARANLALPVLGSTDAQSLGGLIATDLHGTGRDHGFLSEQILGLRVVLPDGDARDVGPGDPLFHAAMGGLGAVGVVTEVELQLVESFNLHKRTAMVDRAMTETQLDELILQHDHLSYYYIGGTSKVEAVRAHTWDQTHDPVTEGWDAAKAAQELADFGISAFLPQLAEALVQLDEDHALSNLAAPDHHLIMPAQRGFGRKLFYRHDEIELAVPFEAYHDCLREVLKLLGSEDYFSIVEVRFTPDRSQSLIGPGVGRRSAWIELATPLSQPRDTMYARVEAILRAYGGRPHLGKKTTFTHHELLDVYGERFTAFQAVRARVDPTGKMLNPFARRLFGG